MSADAVIDSQGDEVDFDLGAFDGKKISCRLNRSLSGSAQKAVILSHGLTGHPFEHIHMQAADYFTVRGYDVYRFAYYCDGNNYRTLSDCTLEIHGKDLNAVVDFAQQKYDQVFVCGHSYGGLTVLFAQPDVTAAAFWDASFTPYEAFWQSDAEHCAELDCYVLDWGCRYLVGKDMVEEAKSLTADKAEGMAAQFKAPSLVALAGDNAENANRGHLYEALSCEKDLQDITGADHCFTKGDTVYDLLEKTNNWFERA